MALAAAIQGAKRPTQTITWIDADGDAVDLTGATITARIRNYSSRVTVDSDGTFEVTDGPNGEFTWAYSSDDVAAAGLFEVQFTAAYGSQPTPAKTITETWQIHRAI